LQLGFFETQDRFVFVSGYETKQLKEIFFRSRWNLTRKNTIIIRLASGKRFFDSEFFDEKDYEIRFLETEPQFTYLPIKNVRLILKYKFKSNVNKPTDEEEKALIHDFNLEATYRQTSKTSIKMNTSFVNVDFTGMENSSLEFAMLSGLKDGGNYLWNLDYNRKLSNNIQLSVSYEGRKTGISDPIHIGRAQLKATF